MKKILTALACVSFLAGCSDDGGGDSNDAAVGYLTYSGVRGLTYETASQSGITGDKGEFRYYPGETVAFRLGDIVLFDNVPAKERLSPVDLIPGSAETLNQGTIKDGLTTHLEVETQLATFSTRLINVFGFLSVFDEDSKWENGLTITDATLEKIAAFQLDAAIDFDKPVLAFGNTDDTFAPENRLGWGICFDNQPQATCDNPLSGRNVLAEQQTRDYLTQELTAINAEVATSVYLTPYALTIAAGDTSLKTVQVRRLNRELNISDMEVVSTTPAILTVQGIDPVSGQFSFFASGQSGEFAEILVNIRLQDDYRWIRKSLGIDIQ